MFGAAEGRKKRILNCHEKFDGEMPLLDLRFGVDQTSCRFLHGLGSASNSTNGRWLQRTLETVKGRNLRSPGTEGIQKEMGIGI